jgi:hypothetical protein
MKKGLQLILILSILPHFISSQTYLFDASSAPYVELSGGTPAVNATWDDPGYNVPIGFVFNFYGNTISTVHQIPTIAYPLLTTDDSADTLGFFMVFGADLIDRGYADTLFESPITYKTTGAAGNRVFTMEWKNAGFFKEYFYLADNNDFVNFQMRLYENDGTIEYHFGPSNVSNPELDYDSTGAFVGLVEKISSVTGFSGGEALLLTGNPTNPNVVESYIDVYLNGTIPANTVYTFTRDVTAVDDLVTLTERPYFSPNPCNDFIGINPAGLDEIVPPLDLYNSTGMLVKSIQQVETIETSDLPSGIYALKFQTKAGLKSERIMILH